MITLYSGPLSLFSRKVEIALLEKGLAFEIVMAPFTQSGGYQPKLPEVAAINPKGQVPVLVDGDVAIYDSTVILEYLEDAHPSPPLYPASAGARAACRLYDLYADEILLPPLRGLMHRTEQHAADDQRWLAAEADAAEAAAGLARRFAKLDADLEGRSWLCGAFGAADISVFLPVHYSERLAGPSLDGAPRLAEWRRRMLERASVAKVVAAIRDADARLSAPVDGARA